MHDHICLQAGPILLRLGGHQSLYKYSSVKSRHARKIYCMLHSTIPSLTDLQEVFNSVVAAVWPGPCLFVFKLFRSHWPWRLISELFRCHPPSLTYIFAGSDNAAPPCQALNLSRKMSESEGLTPSSHIACILAKLSAVHARSLARDMHHRKLLPLTPISVLFNQLYFES